MFIIRLSVMVKTISFCYLTPCSLLKKNTYVPVPLSSTLILHTSIILYSATFRETVIAAKWIIYTKNDFEPSVLKQRHFSKHFSAITSHTRHLMQSDRVVFEKLWSPNVIKNPLQLLEHEYLLPCLQQPASGRYLEPHEFSPKFSILSLRHPL